MITNAGERECALHRDDEGNEGRDPRTTDRNTAVTEDGLVYGTRSTKQEVFHILPDSVGLRLRRK